MSTPARTRKPRPSRTKPEAPPALAVVGDEPAGDPPPPVAAPEPEKGSQKTLYRISTTSNDFDEDGDEYLTLRPRAEIEASDAKTALKVWAEQQGEDFAGGALEAVPVRNITSVTVGVETRRQLTIT